jgi:hypothetical protein
MPRCRKRCLIAGAVYGCWSDHITLDFYLHQTTLCGAPTGRPLLTTCNRNVPRDSIFSRNHTGWALRPGRLLPDLSRYLIATFRPFMGLRRRRFWLRTLPTSSRSFKAHRLTLNRDLFWQPAPPTHRKTDGRDFRQLELL